MTIDYEKQAQDYYGKAPLIILGSGASAAYGLSGMGALNNYLISNIDIQDLEPGDMAGWEKFCELLKEGQDLETVLLTISISEKLTSRIIWSTWQLINSEDLEVFHNFLSGRVHFPLGTLLAHIFKSSVSYINIVTTNYDRLAEYACEQERLHHYSGFTHGFYRHLASPQEIKVDRKVNIWKVHGSLDWFKHPTGEIIALTNVREIPDKYEAQIVTPGTQKYHRTHLEPYRSVINNADQAIVGASSYLCIGYGFNDEHIQPKLVEKCCRHHAPITIISRSISEAAKKHILNKPARNYLAIERGNIDAQSVIYSSLAQEPLIVDKNLWSLQGYLSLVM